MPYNDSVRISELPSATALTGAELIPVVQEQETRQTTVTSLFGGYPPTITNARWTYASTHPGAPVNAAGLTVCFDRTPFQAVGLVDAVLAPGHAINWEWTFDPYLFDSGMLPLILPTHQLIRVLYLGFHPIPLGTLVARAKLYNATGQIVATSNDLTLTFTESEA